MFSYQDLIQTMLREFENAVLFLWLRLLSTLKPQPNNRNMSTQHCWAQHVTCVWPPCCVVFWHVGCCWLKVEDGQIWANNTQHVATRHNMVAKRAQHVVPNNVAICCVDMLRSFGRGLIHQENGAFWKCFSIQRNLKTLVLCFSTNRYHLENWVFRKLWCHNYHPSFSNFSGVAWMVNL